MTLTPSAHWQAEQAGALIILLHGVGAFGYDLDPLADILRKGLPGSVVMAPDAPFAFTLGPGRQWFSQDDISPQNRPGRVVNARGAFDELMAGILRAHTMMDRLHRVVIIGFSQGAIMALDAAAEGRWPVAGIAGLSGRLPTQGVLRPAADTPILLVHGTEDTVVPPGESEHAFNALKAAGADVELHLLAQTGHAISPRVARMVLRFAAGVLAKRAV